MDSWQWGVVFGPLFSLFLFGFVAVGIKWLIATRMPDCWLRDQLLRERIKTKYSASHRRLLDKTIGNPRRKS